MEEQYAATIKENVKERYSKIALTGNSDCNYLDSIKNAGFQNVEA
jgi:hypothetical protein